SRPHRPYAGRPNRISEIVASCCIHRNSPLPSPPSHIFKWIDRLTLTSAMSSNRLRKPFRLARSFPSMSCYRSLCAGAIIIGLMIPSQALALEFVTVGPRAMGMGGAGVAVTTDALATYWNPAGLAMTQTVDVRIQGSGQVIDRLGIANAIHDLENFTPNDPNTAANLTKAQDIANRINRPGATVSVNGSAGLYVKGHLGEHAFGLNVSDVATGGGFVSTPVTAAVNGSNVSLTGAMALLGFEARQVAFSYAYSDKTFSIGVTGKILQGAA